MHLLAAKPGEISDGTNAIDLGQTPGEIVILSAADTELACLAAAHAALPEPKPSLRLANLLMLQHHLSVDAYVEDIIAQAKLVVVRLIGGRRYWPYGLEEISATCRANNIPLAVLPGDDQPDPELADFTTLPPENAHRLWRYCTEGGIENAQQALLHAASLIGGDAEWLEPRPLLKAGLYWRGETVTNLADLRWHWRTGRPAAAIVFYRALMQAGTLKPIDALIAELDRRDINVLPVFVNSLKDAVAADLLAALFAEAKPDLVLNATGFAVSQPGGDFATPFDVADCPVLQVVLSSGSAADWEQNTRGLSPRDLAMQAALPELDGRILTRAISFKAAARYDAATQCNIVAPEPVPDRIAFVVDLAERWIRLRKKAAGERTIAVVLANYPNRDGRIGNGVGLDTPAGTVNLLRAMRSAGYAIADIPADGDALINRLLDRQAASARLSVADYREFFATLPAVIRHAVIARWGQPESDPHCVDGHFALPLQGFGATLIGIQPARGYGIDPVSSYHDPDLVPPHAYFAFYAYLRDVAEVDAIVNMGKHGNLEWLPGKSLALSAACYPEAVMGPVPLIYPFIVNDPGEGTQAKRRSSAVIIDHLTPPLTRAESYGPLSELETLVDEYYEASQVDPRRCAVLKGTIVDLAQASGLAADCGIAREDDTEAALIKLDNHLCELKELQIRDGLHIFGESPKDTQLADLLVALTRLPRRTGVNGDASLLRALAADLGLDFDPLDAKLGDRWTGPRPAIVAAASDTPWRTIGDAVERLELLASKLTAGTLRPEANWTRSRAVLDFINAELRPSVAACGDAELSAVLTGLDGRFVKPGPSGAPTRGRLDMLPTGRNFFSVDTRAVPTPTAWALGWKSAALLLDRHRQEHGAWPKSLVLSAWGTANMRTGGDDIAQALALMGVQPRWDAGASGRVSGFEIMPLSVLDRPRVDVTLRVSGFFRDAFPAQIDLFDSAARAVAALDEPDSQNPLAARNRAERAALVAKGASEAEAEQRAGYRIFGSKPGAYGAGLQALIDEKGWNDGGDLARAYLAWGGYAYGAGVSGAAEGRMFETRLAQVDAVLHNQDNREHDLLDSDDYYQFEGGLAATVQHLTGRKAVVWHNDHSRPETPQIRSLDQEIARVVRARVVNPKWIAGVMRHGYKGAFEMAATVDYLFAFAATADCVADHHFDAVFEAYLLDDAVRDFIAAHNPAALKEIADRLQEAQTRGLWKSRHNSAHQRLAAWSRGEAA
ncbi:cobaltochelatase subunit CobN [Dongia sp.]|uniref:cobaltochelatase subunit CobN n=1 Tax=Dongia sp. TaxID=1977262 RepID=UPI0037502605